MKKFLKRVVEGGELTSNREKGHFFKKYFNFGSKKCFPTLYQVRRYKNFMKKGCMGVEK